MGLGETRVAHVLSTDGGEEKSVSETWGKVGAKGKAAALEVASRLAGEG